MGCLLCRGALVAPTLMRGKLRHDWVQSKWLGEGRLLMTKAKGCPRVLPLEEWKRLNAQLSGGGAWPPLQDIAQYADVNDDLRDGALEEEDEDEDNNDDDDDDDDDDEGGAGGHGQMTLKLSVAQCTRLLSGEALDSIAGHEVAPQPQPLPLPAGWTEHKVKDGRHAGREYYYNAAATPSTTWQRPAPPSAPAPQSLAPTTTGKAPASHAQPAAADTTTTTATAAAVVTATTTAPVPSASASAPATAATTTTSTTTAAPTPATAALSQQACTSEAKRARVAAYQQQPLDVKRAAHQAHLRAQSDPESTEGRKNVLPQPVGHTGMLTRRRKRPAPGVEGTGSRKTARLS